MGTTAMITPALVLEVSFYVVVLGSLFLYVIPTNAAEAYWHGRPLGYASDLSDTQWSSFRRSIPLLLIALTIVPGVHYIVRRYAKGFSIGRGAIPVSSMYHLLVGLSFLVVYHGWYSVVILLLITIAFAIGHIYRGSIANPIITWLFALSIIFIKESYRFPRSVGKLTAFLFIPAYGGMYPWKFAANFLILRIISYNMDLFWASRAEHKKKDDEIVTEIKRKEDDYYSSIVRNPRPIGQYNIINFVSYALYAPLYIAGPILPFNAFIAQMEKPQTVRSKWQVAFYGLRWFIWLGLMETLTHFYPFFAVTYSGVFRTLSPPQLAVTAYMTLKLMWLKFFLMWRFFRLWAMLDGVETVENMPRCMSNNYSLESFWRQWHSSYNHWLVRYIYIPLGGRENRSRIAFVVFLFVGLWHDAEVKLVAWGLLNSVFFVIEHQAKSFIRRPNMLWLRESSYFPIIQAGSAGFYIIVLIGVNLVGYSVGVGGVWLILKRFLQEPHYQTLIGSFLYMVVGASAMFLLRRYKLCQP